MRKRNHGYLFSVLIVLIFLFTSIHPVITRLDDYEHDNYAWIPANLNLVETDFHHICFINEWDSLLVLSKSNTIYSKNSYQKSWNEVQYDKNWSIESILLDANGRILLASEKYLWIKDGLNQDWTKIQVPAFGQTSGNRRIFSVKSLEIIILCSDDDIFVYQENRWDKIPNPQHLSMNDVVYQPLQNRLLSGTEKNGIWQFDIKGNQKKMLMEPTDISIQQLFIPANQGNACFATAEKGDVFRSFDGGETWESIGSFAKGTKIHHYCEEEARLGVFFAFTESGIYITTDHGSSWEPMQNLVEGVNVLDGCYYPYEECYYIVTAGKGIRRSMTVPSQPAPKSPSDGEDVYYLDVMLAWNLFGRNDLPGSYHILVSHSKDFSDTVYEKQNIMGDSIIVPDDSLQLHTPYFWKVRVETLYWNSGWSESFQFTKRQRWLMKQNQSWCQWNEKKMVFHRTEPITTYIDQGSLYIPVRSFMEQIGAIVEWDNALKRATIRYQGRTVLLSFDPAQYSVQIRKKRSYIPARYLADLWEWKVEWDSKNETAILSETKRSSSATYKNNHSLQSVP